MTRSIQKIKENILRGSLIMVVAWSISSCADLLEVEPEGSLSGDILVDEVSIQQALIGAYYSLTGINDGSAGGELLGGDFVLIPELLTRQAVFEVSWDDVNGPSYADFMAKDILAVNLEVETNWRRAYEVINTVNSILQNIENVSDATARNRIQGEARAIRGILYFELVRLWGPQYSSATANTLSVPLIETPFGSISEIVTPTLASVQAVYDFAEADLSAASTLLQPFGTNGVFLNYYACEAYLMRLKMQQNEYGEAEDHADNILGSTQFSLTGTPLAAFNNSTNSTEDIFAIQQTQSNNTGDVTSGTGLTYFYSSISGNGVGGLRIIANSLTDDFLVVNGPQFPSIDLRATIDTLTSSTTTVSDINTAYYRHITSTSTLSSSKFASADRVVPVIRLAEIYLSRAECIMEETFPGIDPVAIDDLNEVRARAGLPTLNAGDFTSAIALRDSIVIERKREFLHEGLLFHDLKRWEENGWSGIIGNDGTSATNARFILPIPQAETDTWTD